jgi:hypothetical protein
MDGGDGKPLPPIALYDNEDADVVANEYCEKHGLDVKVTAPQLADALRNSLKEKTPAEKAEAPAAAATEEEKGDATDGRGEGAVRRRRERRRSCEATTGEEKEL